MAKNTKTIKKRITSVKNTKKITKSMQLIAAAKMQKSARLVQLSKRYTELGTEVLTALRAVTDIEHPLLALREPKIELLIVISSNRGLCGSFNVNVISAAREYAKQWKELSQEGQQLKVLAVGKKSASFAKKSQLSLEALYEHMSDNPNFQSVLPIAQTALREFRNGTVDKVTMIYTDYKSSFYQTVVVKTVLPIRRDDLIGQFIEAGEDIEEQSKAPKFEPNTQDLLDYLLPRMVEAQIYQGVLESAASEHSSRMIAMKNATDAASDMIKGLTLEYNKSRQSAITQEMSEIIGGIDALSDIAN